MLSDEEIDANAKRYFEQAALVIDTDPEKLEVRFNGEWLAPLDFAAVLKLTRTITVARILERDDFANRFAAQAPISVSELLYPLMQAYDSVAVEADVELGGTDQLYNLLTGRDVMEAYGLEPQVALTTPLLLGSDGEKMSKSKGNTIGLTDPPEEQFGKTMRISDEALEEYYRLVMETDPPAPDADPLEAKLALARFIVTRSHGEEAAARRGGAFHARGPRGQGARRGSGGRPRRRNRGRPSARLARRSPRRRVDERGPPAPRSGSGEGGGRDGHGDGFACRAAKRPDRPGGKTAICTGFCGPPQFLTAPRALLP